MDFSIPISIQCNPVSEVQKADTSIQYFEKKTMNNSVFKKAITNVIGIAGVAALSGALQAASFDCAKAGASIEKLICSDANVSQLDKQLAQAYKAAMENAGNKDGLKKVQRAWLKEVRNECKDINCLANVYDVRIKTLSSLAKTSMASQAAELPSSSQPSDSASENNIKKPITIKFIYGDSYPICKPYLDMLNAARYTEAPACERKILPQFPQFKSIDWIEMTNRKVIEKELTELIDLEYFARREVGTPNHKGAIWNLKKSLNGNVYKYFSFNVDVNGDGVDETVYKKEYFSGDAAKYKKCTKGNIFHVKNSLVDKKYLQDRLINKYYNYTNPYGAFNFSGSSELFLHEKKLYVSSWVGEFVDGGANLNIYGFGNKKICGFLIN